MRTTRVRLPDREDGAASRPAAGGCAGRALQGWGTASLLNTTEDWAVAVCQAVQGSSVPGGEVMYPEDSGPLEVPPGVYMIGGHVNFSWSGGATLSAADVDVAWFPSIGMDGSDLSGGAGNLGYAYGRVLEIPIGTTKTSCRVSGAIEVTQGWVPTIEVGIHGGGRAAFAEIYLHVFGFACAVEHAVRPYESS